MSKLDIVDFPDNVPAQAGPAQLLFMTPEQYDGLVATKQKTAAASKGKGKAVAMVNDESNYGQSSSKEEQELEKGESAAQRFQHMQ
ncbi:hypothetical protein C0995_003402 [Termitomyces sp. Mi166|nr:hypothetical protein C0995_003402 [Termitomyces sp. Mi166\